MMALERSCIVSGDTKSKDELIRFVCAPDGQVVPDLKTELPGRGVWVTARYADVQEAEKRNLFSRAFKSKCDLEEGLADRTGELLLRSAISWLSMANKSGSLICGRAKVERVLNKGKLALLIEAKDASEDGKKKLRSLKKAFENETGQICETVSSFTIEQLSLALGRENVVHAAITNRHMAEKFMEVIARLEKYNEAERTA